MCHRIFDSSSNMTHFAGFVSRTVMSSADEYLLLAEFCTTARIKLFVEFWCRSSDDRP